MCGGVTFDRPGSGRSPRVLRRTLRFRRLTEWLLLTALFSVAADNNEFKPGTTSVRPSESLVSCAISTTQSVRSRLDNLGHITRNPVIEVNPSAVGLVGEVDSLIVATAVIEMYPSDAADRTDYRPRKRAGIDTRLRCVSDRDSITCLPAETKRI